MLNKAICAAMAAGSIFWLAPMAAKAEGGKVAVFARAYAVAGKENEVKAVLQKLNAQMVADKKAPAIYQFYQSAKDPTQFFAFEVYDSAQVFDNHMKVDFPAVIKEIGGMPEGIFAKPLEIEMTTQIAP